MRDYRSFANETMDPDHINYERYPILGRMGPGRPPTNKVPTALGLMVTALDNYTSDATYPYGELRDVRATPALKRLSFAPMSAANIVDVLSGWSDYTWISRALSEERLVHTDDDEHAERLPTGTLLARMARRDAQYERCLGYLVSHALYTSAQMQSKEHPLVRETGERGKKGHKLLLKANVMDARIVNAFYHSLKALVYDRVGRTILGNTRSPARASLETRLALRPITGDDDFSKSMYYVYARAYPDTAKDPAREGLDLYRLVNSIQLTYTELDDPMSASLETLIAIVLGVVYGPEGLVVYGEESDTYRIESSFAREWSGYGLCQLRAYDDDCEDPDPACFDMSKRQVVIGPGGDFVPTAPDGSFRPAAQSAQAVIHCFEGADGDPIWFIRTCRDDASVAVWRAIDDRVVILEKGGGAMRLRDGDEIWLDVSGNRPTRNYDTGAVILFNETWRYCYDTNGRRRPDGQASPEYALQQHADSAQGKAMGFQLHNPITNEYCGVLYEILERKRGSLEFKIGRRKESVDYVCGLVEKPAVSRVHATLVSDGSDGMLFCDGDKSARRTIMSANGTEIVRGDTVIPVGRARFAPGECALRDGDVIFLPSRRDPQVILEFYYLFPVW